MGTWSAGNFANEQALAWLGGLRGPQDVFQALADMVAAPQGQSLPIDDCVRALAAAELVAAAGGQGLAPRAIPPAATTFLATGSLSATVPFIAQARSAIARVRERSELRELWERQDASAWLAVLDNLDRRLAAASAAIQSPAP